MPRMHDVTTPPSPAPFGAESSRPEPSRTSWPRGAPVTLSLLLPSDLAEEADDLRREEEETAEEQARELERQAAALRRLSAAQRELALARLEAAEAGVAQWCVRCDVPMPVSRDNDRCPRCVGRVRRTTWQREARREARK